MSECLLEVNNLNVYYTKHEGFFGKKRKRQILHDVSFKVYENEVLGIVGESGCGKSTLAKAILGMVPEIDGEIIHYSKRPQMIFQDPAGSLNPAKTVGWILMEPLRLYGKFSKDEMRKRAVEMLYKVGLEEKHMHRYPSELSGGQRQRVAIALSLIRRPRLILADEPVSALDVSIQAQILKLLLNLKNEFKLSYIFISHDMDVVYQLCDRVIVMKEGKIVEYGTKDEVFFEPKDDYTKELLAISEQ